MLPKPPRSAAIKDAVVKMLVCVIVNTTVGRVNIREILNPCAYAKLADVTVLPLENPAYDTW